MSIDRGTRAFSERHAMACPPGCGACCHSPSVEATEAELAPLVTRLLESGESGKLRAVLAERDAAGDRRCALFVPEGDSPTRGRCSAYRDRPSICRLFAFAARRDGDGRPELVTCRTLRAADPLAVSRAERDVAAGGPVLFYSDHSLADAAAGSAGELRPINLALAGALERAELALHYGRLEADGAPRLALVEDAPPATAGVDPSQPPPRDAPRPAA